MTDTEKLKKCIKALKYIPLCEDPSEMLSTAKEALTVIGETYHSVA